MPLMIINDTNWDRCAYANIDVLLFRNVWIFN